MQILLAIVTTLAISVCGTSFAQSSLKGSSYPEEVPTESKDLWVYHLRKSKIESIEFNDTPILKAVGFIEKNCPNVPILGKELLSGSRIKIDWKATNEDCAGALSEVVKLAGFQLKTGKNGISIIPRARERTAIRRMNEVIIPSVEFADTPLKDALDFLVQRSVELDSTRGVEILDSKPRRKGISIILEWKPKPTIAGAKVKPPLSSDTVPEALPAGEGAKLGANPKSDIGNTTINLKLTNTSIYESIRLTCEQAGLLPLIDENGQLTVVPASQLGALEKHKAQMNEDQVKLKK